MSSLNYQAMPTLKQLDKNRLTLTIIALLAVACVLAAVFVYLQSGEKVQPIRISSMKNILTEEQKAQYVSEMEATVNSQPAMSAARKSTLVKSMQVAVKKEAPLSEEQKAVAISAMEAQLHH